MAMSQLWRVTSGQQSGVQTLYLNETDQREAKAKTTQQKKLINTLDKEPEKQE